MLTLALFFFLQTGATFYVSHNGSATGDGSMARPWTLQTALNHPTAVKPGATIYLRGGTYTGIFTSRLTGTALAPITVRSYPGEWARIDATANTTNDVINVNGRYTHYMEFEVLRSGFNRYIPRIGCGVDRMGIDVNAGDNKFINLVIHDTSLGIGAFQDAPNTEIYGNVLYYNGWVERDNTGRGCDHGMYGQNQNGTKKWHDNISFQNFATGITPHGTSVVYLNNFSIEGNIVFNNGVIRLLAPNPGMAGRNFWFSNCCPTTHIAQGLRFVRNYLYYPTTAGGAGSFYLLSSTFGAVITENYLMGGMVQITGGHTGLNFRDNKVLASRLTGFTSNTYPGNAYFLGAARPTTVDVIVRPNQYNANRAHVVIYNWPKQAMVDVDISSLGWPAGTLVTLRNVQDYFKDMVIATYDGKPLRVPMTGRTVAAPVGWATPATTFPEFGVFVLEKN